MNAQRTAGIAAGAAGALAVALGAFGAHALRASLTAEALAIWHTAVEYQFWHALALFGLALVHRHVASLAIAVATIAFMIGIILFCGSLYLLALGAPHWIGIITPFGGVAFIVGWLALIRAFWISSFASGN